jgi:hypothetical protein
MHNRIFVLALRNQEVVPSWHSPTSMKSLSRTTDLNLWRIPIVLVYALVNAIDRDASKWLPAKKRGAFAAVVTARERGSGQIRFSTAVPKADDVHGELAENCE